jgi:hypothetical protein
MFGSFPGQPWSLIPTKLTGPKEPTTLWNQSEALRLCEQTLFRDFCEFSQAHEDLRADAWPW